MEREPECNAAAGEVYPWVDCLINLDVSPTTSQDIKIRVADGVSGEEYGETCPSTDPKNTCLASSYETDLSFTHTMEVGEPNPFAPFSHELSVEFSRAYDDAEILFVRHVLVLGDIPEEVPQVWTVATNPTLIFSIIRDPPGGASTATLVEGSTISTSMAIDGSHAAQLEDSFRGGLSVGWADKVEGGLGFIKNIFAAGLQGGFGYATTPVDISVSRSTSRHFDIGISFSTTISTSDSPYLAGQPSDVIVGGGANLRFISAIEISGALKAAVSGSFGGGFNIGRRRLETTDKGVPGYAYPTSGRVLAVSKKLLEVTPDALEERRRKLEAEFTDQAHRKLPGDDVELAGFNPLYNGAPGAAPAEKPTPAPARSPHQAHRKLPVSKGGAPGARSPYAVTGPIDNPMRATNEGAAQTPEKPEPASNPCNRRLDGTDLSDEERRRLGMTFCGKFDGGTAASFSVSLGRATNKESGQSHAIAVSLKDGNAQDVFAVKISQDTVYGTPIFTTMGGSSS